MRAFFQSLSLASASVLVASVSAVAALLIGRVRSTGLRWTAAVLVPFILSYRIYWMPVQLGADSSQYFSWEFLGVGAPFLAGLIVSGLVTFIIARYAKPRP